MFRLGTTDADRTQVQQWVITPLLRLGTIDADRTQTSRLPKCCSSRKPAVFCSKSAQNVSL